MPISKKVIINECLVEIARILASADEVNYAVFLRGSLRSFRASLLGSEKHYGYLSLKVATAHGVISQEGAFDKARAEALGMTLDEGRVENGFTAHAKRQRATPLSLRDKIVIDAVVFEAMSRVALKYHPLLQRLEGYLSNATITQDTHVEKALAQQHLALTQLIYKTVPREVVAKIYPYIELEANGQASAAFSLMLNQGCRQISPQVIYFNDQPSPVDPSVKPLKVMMDKITQANVKVVFACGKDISAQYFIPYYHGKVTVMHDLYALPMHGTDCITTYRVRLKDHEFILHHINEEALANLSERDKKYLKKLCDSKDKSLFHGDATMAYQVSRLLDKRINNATLFGCEEPVQAFTLDSVAEVHERVGIVGLENQFLWECALLHEMALYDGKSDLTSLGIVADLKAVMQKLQDKQESPQFHLHYIKGISPTLKKADDTSIKRVVFKSWLSKDKKVHPLLLEDLLKSLSFEEVSVLIGSILLERNTRFAYFGAMATLSQLSLAMFQGQDKHEHLLKDHLPTTVAKTVKELSQFVLLVYGRQHYAQAEDKQWGWLKNLVAQYQALMHQYNQSAYHETLSSDSLALWQEAEAQLKQLTFYLSHSPMNTQVAAYFQCLSWQKALRYRFERHDLALAELEDVCRLAGLELERQPLKALLQRLSEAQAQLSLDEDASAKPTMVDMKPTVDEIVALVSTSTKRHIEVRQLDFSVGETMVEERPDLERALELTEALYLKRDNALLMPDMIAHDIFTKYRQAIYATDSLVSFKRRLIASLSEREQQYYRINRKTYKGIDKCMSRLVTVKPKLDKSAMQEALMQRVTEVTLDLKQQYLTEGVVMKEGSIEAEMTDLGLGQKKQATPDESGPYASAPKLLVVDLDLFISETGAFIRPPDFLKDLIVHVQKYGGAIAFVSTRQKAFDNLPLGHRKTTIKEHVASMQKALGIVVAENQVFQIGDEVYAEKGGTDMDALVAAASAQYEISLGESLSSEDLFLLKHDKNKTATKIERVITTTSSQLDEALIMMGHNLGTFNPCIRFFTKEVEDYQLDLMPGINTYGFAYTPLVLYVSLSQFMQRLQHWASLREEQFQSSEPTRAKHLAKLAIYKRQFIESFITNYPIIKQHEPQLADESLTSLKALIDAAILEFDALLIKRLEQPLRYGDVANSFAQFKALEKMIQLYRRHIDSHAYQDEFERLTAEQRVLRIKSQKDFQLAVTREVRQLGLSLETQEAVVATLFDQFSEAIRDLEQRLFIVLNDEVVHDEIWLDLGRQLKKLTHFAQVFYQIHGDHYQTLRLKRLALILHERPHAIVLKKQGELLSLPEEMEIALLSGYLSMSEPLRQEAPEALVAHPTFLANLELFYHPMLELAKTMLCVKGQALFELESDIASVADLIKVLNQKVTPSFLRESSIERLETLKGLINQLQRYLQLYHPYAEMVEESISEESSSDTNAVKDEVLALATQALTALHFTEEMEFSVLVKTWAEAHLEKSKPFLNRMVEFAQTEQVAFMTLEEISGDLHAIIESGHALSMASDMATAPPKAKKKKEPLELDVSLQQKVVRACDRQFLQGVCDKIEHMAKTNAWQVSYQFYYGRCQISLDGQFYALPRRVYNQYRLVKAALDMDSQDLSLVKHRYFEIGRQYQPGFFGSSAPSKDYFSNFRADLSDEALEDNLTTGFLRA